MIRILALAGVAVLASAAAAHAQPSPAPAEYVARAGASDKFEIDEARLAERRSHNARVLAFAREMVRDHTDSTAKVVAAATRAMGRAPPPAVLEDHQRDALRDLSGAAPRDFDRVYMRQQADAHREALDLHRNYAENGTDPELKRAAMAIRPVVQRHLDMADRMAAAMR